MRQRNPGAAGALIALAAFAAAAAPGPAWAYLDPGTGGMLLQLLLGGVAGLLVVARLYWQRLKALFSFRKTSTTGTGGSSDDRA